MHSGSRREAVSRMVASYIHILFLDAEFTANTSRDVEAL
jgi:hypothetical protein